MTGRLVGDRYRLLELIGKGGMAVVHRAEDTATGEVVAVKILARRNLSDDSVEAAELASRVAREARALVSLDTPHIVRVIEARTDGEDGDPFIAMELMKGEDLAQLLTRLGPLPTQLALKIVRQACAGLHFAHEAGVVHRDIKPANLFLTTAADGSRLVKVLDFGIAKIAKDAGSATLTETGSMLGSPQYMSPEQIVSPKTVGPSTDIWSLGIVLFKLLSGRTPLQEGESVGQIIVSVMSGMLLPLQDVAPWVDAKVVRIVDRALRHRAESRFETTKAMLDALDELLPDGWQIRPEEVVSLAAPERGQVAQRFAPSIAPPFVDVDIPSPSTRNHEETGAREAGHVTTTGANLAVTQSAPPAKRIGRSAAIGALLVAIVGIAAWRVSTQPSTLAVRTPRALAHERVSLAGTTMARPTNISVRIPIHPASAIATVNNEPAKVEDGAIELHGPVGSVHVVQLAMGPRKERFTVAITTSVPIPAELTMREAAQSTPVVTTKPTVKPREHESLFDKEYE